MLDVVFPLVSLGILVWLIQRAPSASWTKSYRGNNHKLSAPNGEHGAQDFHFEVHGPSISIWTSGLNAIPSLIVLRRGSAPVLRRIYDLGALVCLIGLGVAFLGSFWALIGVWREVWTEAEVHARTTAEDSLVKTIAKRAGLNTSPIDHPASSSSSLQPIVSARRHLDRSSTDHYRYPGSQCLFRTCLP